MTGVKYIKIKRKCISSSDLNQSHIMGKRANNSEGTSPEYEEIRESSKAIRNCKNVAYEQTFL